MRIHKMLAQAGLCSRREGERWIQDGKVQVNGQVERNLATTISVGVDVVSVDGRPVLYMPDPEVWMLYKPKDCLCTLADRDDRSTIRQYFPNTRARLVPIGRLDYDSEGLLLLTNHGLLTHRITHPRFGIHKQYFVKVKGIVESETLKTMQQGFVLEGAQRRAIKAHIIHTRGDKTWLDVTLKEGIQHLIKKAFDSFGHQVLKIKRYQVGPIILPELKPGETQRLSKEETKRLFDKCALPNEL